MSKTLYATRYKLEEEISTSRKLVLTDMLYVDFEKVFDRKTSIPETYEICRWEQRSNVEKDFNYLFSLYKATISLLSNELNRIHKVEKAEIYWRLCVGPWLKHFIDILFYYYSSSKELLDSGRIKTVRLLNIPADMLATDDFNHFMVSASTPVFIEQIFSMLVPRILGNYEVEVIRRNYNYDSQSLLKDVLISSTSSRSTFKIYFKRVLNHFFNYISNDEIIAFNSYLNYWNEFKLTRRIRLRGGELSKKNYVIRDSLRSFDLVMTPTTTDTLYSEFESILLKLIPKFMPRAYLEGYENLVSQVERLPSAKKQRKILVGTYFFDEVLSLWIGECLSNGSKFFIVQHGGHYGMAPQKFHELEEVEVSTRYLSWGWRTTEDKVVPYGSPLLVNGRFSKPKAKPLAVLTLPPLEQIFYRLEYGPISYKQNLDFFSGIYAFLTSLPQSLHPFVSIRYYPGTSESIKSKLQEKLPKLNYLPDKLSFRNVLRQHGIYIGTYNSTTFLECLGMNYPTIIFWNPSYWELREDAFSQFLMLEDAGIFHHSGVSASSHLQRVLFDPGKWWTSSKTQAARDKFVGCYARSPVRPIEALKELLR